MGVSASALSAERFKLDLIANNIANYNTTGYRRRVASQAERFTDFEKLFAEQSGIDANKSANGKRLETQWGDGVQITGVQEDPSELRLKFDPSHPDADENGYVRLSNVDLLTEITDMLMAQRAYEANVTALNATKQMAVKALEIGK